MIMTVKPGYNYYCDISVKYGLVPVKISAVIRVDSETSFHGEGTAMGKTIGFKNGVIKDGKYCFSVTAKGMTAAIEASMNSDGSIAGIATLAGSKPMPCKGKVTREEKA